MITLISLVVLMFCSIVDRDFDNKFDSADLGGFPIILILDFILLFPLLAWMGENGML